MPSARKVSRRQLTVGTAWAAPAVVVAAAAPAYAISCEPVITISNPLAPGLGFQLLLKDGKFNATPITTNYLTGNRMAVVPFLITACGSPLVGAAVTVSWAGNVFDSVGNTVLKLVAENHPSNVPQTLVDNAESTTTNGSGIASIGVATANLSAADPLLVSGTLTVSVAATPTSSAGSATFTWGVVNA